MRHPDIAYEFFPDIINSPPEKSLIINIESAGGGAIDFVDGKGGRFATFTLSNLSNNLIKVNKMTLEVLQWEPYPYPPPIGARIDTFKYKILVRPEYLGEYIITEEKFKYYKGDIDEFEILCDSPPGNKYLMRLNFYCEDVATKKGFMCHSDNFEIKYHRAPTPADIEQMKKDIITKLGKGVTTHR